MNNPQQTNTEKQLLREAAKVLADLTGSRIKEHPLPKEDREIDARITISFAGAKHDFNVELKGEIRESQVLHIIEQFGQNKDQWLLIARYIPQPLKGKFKKHGINYLELSGNCYINVTGIFIYVADQKVTPVREVATGKLWKTTGLKFLMVIINNPDLLEASYREIASAAGIALGNVGPLLAELREGGYNREKLIVHWTEMFHATLKPKLLRGRFRFLTTEFAKGWQNKINPEIFWGGEPGAALLTGHLVPEQFTIYSTKPGNELTRELAIVPANDGNITILEKFWGQIPAAKTHNTNNEKATAAPPILIYADLINDMDSRNKEVAERIKRLYINDK